MVTVDAECEDCGGTGLYVGMVEYGTGSAAVCSTCDGTGCMKVSYKPWAGRRKGRRGIKTVRQPWGHGTPVTYAEFVAGKRP